MQAILYETKADAAFIPPALFVPGGHLASTQASPVQPEKASTENGRTRRSRHPSDVSRKKYRLHVPSDLVITSPVLVGMARRLHTQAIEEIIEQLIDELNGRAGDPDCEPEEDCDVDDEAIILTMRGEDNIVVPR